MRSTLRSRLVALSISACACVALAGAARARQIVVQTPAPNPPAAPKPAATRGAARAKSAPGESDAVSAGPAAARVADVLWATAADAGKWRDHAAAARVQSQVADLTWQFDTGEARACLVRAWEAAGRVEEKRQEGASLRRVSPRARAQGEVLAAARRRAPDLAERWLAEMTDEAAKDDARLGTQPFDDRSARSAVLLRMAAQSVESDPAAAADLAIESLADGVSFSFQSVLVALQAKDARQAERVFRAALARLQAAGASPDEILILYSFLYTPGFVHAPNTTEDRGHSQIAINQDRTLTSAPADSDPDLALDFLRAAAEIELSAPLPSQTADAQSAARAQSQVISTLLVKMTPLPRQAAALQERLNLIVADANFAPTQRSAPAGAPEPRAGEGREEYLERRVDLLEKRAGDETDPLRRDILYAEAAVATAAARYERGWSLSGKIKDDELRPAVTDWLTLRAALYFVKAGDLDRAEALLAKDHDAAQRAVGLVAGAQSLIKLRDTIRARRWLEEAARALRSAAASADSARAAFGVVAAYGRFDKLSALQSLGDAVALLNRVPEETVRDDERAPDVRRFSGFETPELSAGTSGFGLQSVAESFEPGQFEDVLALLGTIKNAETRGLLTLAFCRANLKPSDAKPAKTAAAAQASP